MPIFFITLPIFFIIAAGWLMRKFNVVKDSWINILNSFTYYVSLPALIVASFWEINFLDKNYLFVIFLSLITIVLFSLLVFIALHFLKISRTLKASIFLSATVGNTIYMGFPLVEMAFGKELLPSAALVGVIYLIIPILASIFIIKYWHSRDHKITKHLLEFLRNPLMISVFVGVALSFVNFDIAVINSVKKAFAMLGATASPVALFTLGEFLYGKFLKKDLNLVFFTSFLKIIIFPMAVAVVGGFFIMSQDNIDMPVLLASMPVAVTTFVIAEKFNLDKELVGNSLFISTIFSFIIAPLILWLM